MPRRLTVAERLASAERDFLLEEIADQSSWDRFLVEQAVFAAASTYDTFTANDMRDLLPEMGHGFLGAAISGLRSADVIAHTGRAVPSTSPATHGHRLAVWQLTSKGKTIAANRAAARKAKAA